MKPMLRWLAGNLPLMVLATILAVLAWIVAAEQADPSQTQPFPSEIPVTPVGKSEGLEIVGEFDERVQVTVRAPESVWRSIELDDFSATVDLTGVETGTHRLPVEVTLDKEPVQLTWEPEYVTVELAPRAERSVPVRVVEEGEPALGYLTQWPTLTPSTVIAIGPSTYVTRVVEAAAYVSVEGADSDIEGDFSLQPLDSDGDVVPYVTLSPAEAFVRIPVELSEEYRSLTVNPVRVGLPAFGYAITGFSVDPDTVTVSGARSVIASLPGFIETEAINVQGAQSDVTVHPALNVPENVVVVSGQQITVTFFVEPIQSSLTMEITPTLQGLGSGLTATISPRSVEVFLSGPLSKLEAMTSGDVRVILDLFEREPGTYQIEPEVIVAPGGVTAQGVLPSSLQVEILTTPTPDRFSPRTPTPTLTPSPTPTLAPTPTPTPTPQTSGSRAPVKERERG